MALDEPGDYKEASGEQRTNKRDTPEFWGRWITIAKRAAHQHWQDSSRAWREDNAQNGNSLQDGNRSWSGSGGVEWDGARYPIWWSTNQLMRSAFYSRTPEIYCRRVFGIDDKKALTASLIMDRTGRYAIETGDLDCTMRDCVADYLNSDKTTTQVCVKYEKVKKPIRRAVTPDIDPNTFLDVETAQPVTGEIFQDAQTGELYTETIEEVVDVKNIYARAVPYNHIIHTPTARIFQEITDIGFYFCFTKDEAEDRFGAETVKSWPSSVWKHSRNMIAQDEQTRDSNDSGKYQAGESSEKSADLIIEGWEIWSNVTKKVYWFCPNYPEDFLEPPKEDPYKLAGFFPCPPFVIGSKPASNMYPTIPFVRVWPTLDILHIMYGRVMNLIDGARRRALVAGDEDLVTALNQIGDAEFVSCQDFKNLINGEMGVDKLVWYVPVQELVNCIAELNAQDEKFRANYDMWRGVPDILRGASDPIETAAAVETKVSAAHDRFKNEKKAIADLARDTIQMMVDLYLYLFDDEKIKRITGFAFMQSDDQANFDGALAMLRNDQERTIRIEVETDTTSYLGEQIRIQQRNAAVTTVVEGLSKIQPLLEQSPQGAAIAARVMAESLDGYGAGRQFVEDVQKYINAWVEKLEEPAPEGPPPPDYESMKLEVQRMDAETRRMKAEGETYKSQMQQMRDDFRLQLEQQKQEFEQYIQQNYLALDANRIAGEMENKDADNARLEIEAQAKVIQAMKPEPEKQSKGEGTTNIIVNNAAGNAPSAVPELPIDILGSI